MCFIVAETEKKAETLHGYRSVEVLGYHKRKQKVEILFLLYLYNGKKNNTLQLLHPGNVSCNLADFSKGLPWHCNELQVKSQAKIRVLESIYSKIFDFDSKEKMFHLRNVLTSYDSLLDIDINEQKKITIWNDVPGRFIKPLWPMHENTKWVPFSAWRLGPFPFEGEYLMALNVTISNESYSMLVNRDSFFTVDGPKRLMGKLDNIYIPYFTSVNDGWQERLSLFENRLHFKESYDVVVLDEPYSDKVIADMKSSYRVTEGPLRPVIKKSFKRYITADSSFKLDLCYADSLKEDIEEFPFIEESSAKIPMAISKR